MKRTLGEEFESIARDWLAHRPIVPHEWRSSRSALGGDRVDLICNPGLPSEVWASAHAWSVAVGTGGDHDDFEDGGRDLSGIAVAGEALTRLIDLLKQAGVPLVDHGSQRTIEQLESMFEERTLRDGGILVLSPADALELIHHARESRLPILGIDAFRVDADHIQPVMSESIDYSGGAMPAGAWSEAVRFIIGRRRAGLAFEVVIGRTPLPAA